MNLSKAVLLSHLNKLLSENSNQFIFLDSHFSKRVFDKYYFIDIVLLSSENILRYSSRSKKEIRLHFVLYLLYIIPKNLL